MAGSARRSGEVAARFPSLVSGGGYESYYLRAVDPESGRALWLRHTFHAAGEGESAVGSIWLTLFGADGGVLATKHSTTDISPEPSGGWVRVGDSVFGPDGIEGHCEGARWSLTWSVDDRPLRHLPNELLYRLPLPKTKPESPMPVVHVSGEVSIGDTTFVLDGWPGMVGHNWGTQHAERWIWLHGIAFAERDDAWLDLLVGRVRVGGKVLPWVAMGTLSLAGERMRLGGFGRRPEVIATPNDLALTVKGAGGSELTLRAQSPLDQIIVWRYADPDGSEHQVANCSACSLELEFRGRRGEAVSLTTQYGGTYELGMRETDHGLAVQPFSDP